MRVNVYAEEMTDRVEIIINKVVDGHALTGLRFYGKLFVTFGSEGEGPFSDSSAVTFWGKRDLRAMLRKALALLDDHYANQEDGDPCPGCVNDAEAGGAGAVDCVGRVPHTCGVSNG